ncbi:MAG: hypothetical protein JXM72_09220, partial [Deltaproteobacteria bacterium]|nr:hypothetical protein [Deltaproteobacteria bacterium]
IFFPQFFSEYQDLITAESPIIVKARVGLNTEDAAAEVDAEQVEIFAEEVHPLDNAEAMLAKRLLLRVPAQMEPDGIRLLKDAVLSSKGTCQVTFEIETDGLVVNIDAGKDYLVRPSRDFLTRVASLVGSVGVELQ